jgi:hypothetical protein
LWVVCREVVQVVSVVKCYEGGKFMFGFMEDVSYPGSISDKFCSDDACVERGGCIEVDS